MPQPFIVMVFRRKTSNDSKRAKKHTFFPIWAFFACPRVHSRAKIIDSGLHFGRKCKQNVKIVILPKSCSRCGGSIIFECRAFPESIQKWLRTEMAQEIDENGFRHHLGERCFHSGSLFNRFWGSTGVPELPLLANFLATVAAFWAIFGARVVFLRSKVLGEGAGTDLECPGNAPRQDFRRILDNSLRRFDCSCRPRFIPTPSQSSCKFQTS